MGSVEMDEADNDRGELTDKMLQRAADDIVYRLFDGQTISRFGSLRDFLMEQEDVAELAYRMVMGPAPEVLMWDTREELETRLRKHLEGTTILIDHANDLASEE